MVIHNMQPIIKGVSVAIITMSIYLLVVVVTTPALDPLPAVSAAFQANAIVIVGMGVGIGLQVILSEKSKMMGCRLPAKKRIFGGNTGASASTSFFSFFSLIPLGCCGWWLYLLSLLPGVLGVGVTAVLIEYSQVLAYGGLVMVFGFVVLAAYRLRREQSIRQAA